MNTRFKRFKRIVLLNWNDLAGKYWTIIHAFIWDEAGFEGTTARVRERQKAGDFAGMAAEITDEHVSAFATEATWDTLADALVDKYGGIVDRLVLYSAADETPDRFARYGEVARSIVARHPD